MSRKGDDRLLQYREQVFEQEMKEISREIKLLKKGENKELKEELAAITRAREQDIKDARFRHKVMVQDIEQDFEETCAAAKDALQSKIESARRRLKAELEAKRDMLSDEQELSQTAIKQELLTVEGSSRSMRDKKKTKKIGEDLNKKRKPTIPNLRLTNEQRQLKDWEVAEDLKIMTKGRTKRVAPTR